MRLFIIRHAETDNNQKGIIQGKMNTNISKKGRKQAEKISRKLAKYEIDVVYCSDLKRCRQTIRPYLTMKKTKIHYTMDLRERNYGVFEGKSFKELRKWVEENGYAGRFDFRVKGGESFLDVKKRARIFLKELFRREKGKNVLIVTHGGMKVALLLNIFNKNEKKNYQKYRAQNTALSIIKINDNGKHRATLLNSVRHLM